MPLQDRLPPQRSCCFSILALFSLANNGASYEENMVSCFMGVSVLDDGAVESNMVFLENKGSPGFWKEALPPERKQLGSVLG